MIRLTIGGLEAYGGTMASQQGGCGFDPQLKQCFVLRYHALSVSVLVPPTIKKHTCKVDPQVVNVNNHLYK